LCLFYDGLADVWLVLRLVEAHHKRRETLARAQLFAELPCRVFA
jgi:hypothetical protein